MVRKLNLKIVIGAKKEVTFETLKAAEAFIEGIKISLPSSFEYRIIPKEAEQDDFWSSPGKFW